VTPASLKVNAPRRVTYFFPPIGPVAPFSTKFHAQNKQLTRKSSTNFPEIHLAVPYPKPKGATEPKK
jgi:hypothetical protein